MFELKSIELNVKYNIYAIWKHDELFNLTERYAIKSNDKKMAFITFLHKRTGLNLTSNLHTILEQINKSKESTELYRNMTWANICTVLKHKYGIQFNKKGNKLYSNELTIDDIVFLIEYSHWLLNKCKTSIDEQELLDSISTNRPEQLELDLDIDVVDEWLVESKELAKQID